MCTEIKSSTGRKEKVRWLINTAPIECHWSQKGICEKKHVVGINVLEHNELQKYSALKNLGQYKLLQEKKQNKTKKK